MEFFSHQTSYPFMATRKVWYTLSAILMIGSIVSFATRGLNLGIDFKGGTQITFNTHKAFSQGQVAAVIDAAAR